MNINPSILRQPRKTEKSPSLGGLSRMVSLLRSSMQSMMEKLIDNKTFKVEFADDKVLGPITQSLEKLLKKDVTKIEKGNLEIDTIDEFSINNIGNLNLKQIEKLSISFQELSPIVTLLKNGNVLDQQTNDILNRLLVNMQSLYTSVKTLSSKDSTSSNAPVRELSELVVALKNLESRISSLKAEPKNDSDTRELIQTLSEINTNLETLPRRMPEANFPKSINVANFPPQKYPLPVTNININPLRGYAQTTAITVGTTATALPTTALASRRSMVAYNNSSSVTLYVGGSNVTASNGMVVPPLSYSPAFDAGPKLIIYGIVSSGSADVRVLELSHESVGTHTD